MNGERFNQSEQIRTGGIASRRTVLAALSEAGLLLAAKGPTLAAGGKGGIGGDQFRRPRTDLVQGGKVGGGMDAPTSQGWKKGIDPGKS